MHEGHRKRMLQRLEERDPQLQDHETLEILLYRVIPRANTNGIAHELLETFGSLYDVLHASVGRLCLVKGIGKESAEYLRLVGLIFERVDACKNEFPQKFTRAVFTEFLRKQYASAQDEELNLFLLSANDRVILRKKFTSMRNDIVQATTEEICEVLVNGGAHGIVAAHNHPATSCMPSREDDKFTAHLCVLCSAHNLRFYDHLIVGEDGVYSYFGTGRLESIRREYNFSAIFEKSKLP